MTDLHKLSSEHALSLESLLVRHDVGAAVFFYNIDCRYLASSNTPLYYSDILLYLYSASLFSPCQTCSISPPPLRSILREPPKTFGSPLNIVHICKDGLLQRGFGQDRLQLRCSKKIWSEAIIVMLISAGWLVIGISRSAALYLHYNFFSHQYNVYNYYKCYYHY